MLAQHALDEAAEVRPHVLPLCPVDGHVAPHGLYQLPCDPFQGRLAEHLHRAVVGLQGVVEGEFFFRQTKPFPLKTAADGSCLLEVAVAPGYTEHLGRPEIPRG
jgi:hypothetical protein